MDNGADPNLASGWDLDQFCMYLLFILAHSWEMYNIVQFHWGHIHYIGCLSPSVLFLRREATPAN